MTDEKPTTTARGSSMGAVIDGNQAHVQYETVRRGGGALVVDVADLGDLAAFLDELYRTERERRGGEFEEDEEPTGPPASEYGELPPGADPEQLVVLAPPISESTAIASDERQKDAPVPAPETP